MLTGAQSINATETRYQVKGTDLGIMWTDERGQILAAFGDTFGPGWAGISSGFANPSTIDWRSNTLARSTDRNPSNGMSFNDYVTDRPGPCQGAAAVAEEGRRRDDQDPDRRHQRQRAQLPGLHVHPQLHPARANGSPTTVASPTPTTAGRTGRTPPARAGRTPQASTISFR